MTAIAARPRGAWRDLTGQTVVVIGGTSGIGHEPALLARPVVWEETPSEYAAAILDSLDRKD